MAACSKVDFSRKFALNPFTLAKNRYSPKLVAPFSTKTNQNCPNAVYKSSTTRPSVSHAQKAMLEQSFKSDTTVSTTTFTTFLTENKEGGEERERLSLLPSSLVLVRNVFPGNLFNSFDCRIGRVGWVTKIFTRFRRVFPSDLSRGGGTAIYGLYRYVLL